MGYDGELLYWHHPQWLPPVLSPLLLTLAYLAICGYMAFTLTQPERQPFRFFPEQYGLTYVTVEFPQ